MKVLHEYKTVAIRTPYLKPGGDYLQTITDSVRHLIEDGDIVTVSEKALSSALGKLVNEEQVKASLLAYCLAKYWMRYIWGHVLGPLCHLRKKTIHNFKTYPVKEGSIHKQVALKCAGFLQALLHGSEGGIDGSNLPYSYVSLPLNNAVQVAQRIRHHINSQLKREVHVMIVDTDKTYSLRGFHFTPRPTSVNGIHSFGGILAYVLGRFFRLTQKATPIASAGARFEVTRALEIADLANRARGFGAGRTVWDMADRFHVSLIGVSWEMLNSVEHRPIVVLRPRARKERENLNR